MIWALAALGAHQSQAAANVAAAQITETARVNAAANEAAARVAESKLAAQRAQEAEVTAREAAKLQATTNVLLSQEQSFRTKIAEENTTIRAKVAADLAVDTARDQTTRLVSLSAIAKDVSMAQIASDQVIKLSDNSTKQAISTIQLTESGQTERQRIAANVQLETVQSENSTKVKLEKVKTNAIVMKSFFDSIPSIGKSIKDIMVVKQENENENKRKVA